MRYLCLVLFIWLVSGCSSFKEVELGNQRHNSKESRVILIPMEDFDTGALERVARQIEEKHQFSVAAFTAMGASLQAYDIDKRQYVANEIARLATRELLNHGIRICEKTVIVLTNNDINDSAFRLRYVFSSHYDQACLSVISTARINPVNYGQRKDEKLVYQRLMKLVNKSIGLHHYKYPVSSSRGSVMFGPILGPNDLDSVGVWY